MNKKLMALDIICYGALPFLIWTQGRDYLGDYLALLLSTVPGFIYTIYRFVKERQFNIAGLFIIGSLFINTTVNLLSSTAETMLWNQVYLGYGYVLLYLLSTVIKQPLALYFAIDWSYLQGFKREDSKKLFTQKGIFILFQWLNLLFVVRGIFQSSLKAWLIHKHGVNGYDQVIIYMNISGWVFSALLFIGATLVYSRINKITSNVESASA